MNLGQNGMPAKSMVLVLDSKELWVGCGNKIVIVDTSTLIILDEIAVYQTQRTHVRIMVTDGERVWSADRRSTKILQWEVSSRQLTHIFDCDVDSPVGNVLCSDVTEPRRRFGSNEGTGVRHRAMSDPPGSFGAPSYTEAMFKEAMNSGGIEQGYKADSMRRDDSLSRDTASLSRLVLENSDDEDLESSDKTVSPPVSIPGSQAKFFSEKGSEKNFPSRIRSLSSQTESGASVDSGVSSFRSRTKSDTASAIAGSTSGAVRAHPEDSRGDEVVASERSENVASTGKGTTSVDGSQNVAEQELDSNVVITPQDQTSEQSPASVPVVSKQDVSDNAEVESSSSKSELVNGTAQQAVLEDESVVASDRSLKEGDADKDLNETEAEFELVDRDETRQAFIEGTRKPAPPEIPTTQHCASMATLQMRFNSSSRAPSLMSSQKRKSQRRHTAEDKTKSQSKPWAGRPRLRILAGSINRVTALLLVNGTLWVGRGVGDILTVNVNSTNDDLPLGHVFAQLESDNLLGYENGQVDEIVNGGTNKVVCLRRLEPAQGSLTNEDRFTERYQLIVWEAWGDTEFRRFKDRLDHFNSLVE